MIGYSPSYLGIIHNKGIQKDECLIGTLFLSYVVRIISENKTMPGKSWRKLLWGGRGVFFLDEVKKEVSSFVLLSTNLQIYEMVLFLCLKL